VIRKLEDWDALASGHAEAVEEFAAVVRQLPADAWNRTVVEGKWTPAEITGHLIESYRILHSELRGRAGMELRLSPLRRWVLRHTVLPRILATGRFPAGARAPRETRPQASLPDLAQALAILTSEAHAFSRELKECAQRGRVRLTHAYFGAMSARQAFRLATVHTRHHAGQVTAILVPERSSL
jgi:uncharacterized damage-inducible protein DinB